MKLLNLFLLLMIYTVPLFSQGTFQSSTIDDINYIKIYEKEGEQGLRPYIKAAADSALAILEVIEVEGNGLGERNGERLLDFLGILSLAGDMSSKEALIKAMISPKINGSTIARGLMRLGSQVQPEILSYLDSGKVKDVLPIISILNRMAKIDTTGTYITPEFRETVRDKLVALYAGRTNDDARFIRNVVYGLDYFGDESVIPLLEEIDNKKVQELPYFSKTPRQIIEDLREKK
jgi:hypothetical protein